MYSFLSLIIKSNRSEKNAPRFFIFVAFHKKGISFLLLFVNCLLDKDIVKMPS